MGSDMMTQTEAWAVYDRFFEDGRIRFIEEPRQIERPFRRNTERQEASSKHWSDAYLAAFAEAVGLTLVTFDRALARRVRGSILLST
jgi:predicted nucleic acid-binding protein